jgi:hypothetical protein
MRVPGQDSIGRALRVAHKQIDRDQDGADVRLQVYEDGGWAIRVGPSDYDLDHRGFWGASWLPRGRFNSLALARDLLEQVRDHMAQRGES